MNQFLEGSRFIFESPSKKFSGRSFELAPLKKLGLKQEVVINADDEQLLKISLALDVNTIAPFLGRDGLYLHQLAGNCAVGPGRVGPMATKSELDLCVDLSKLAP